MTPMPGLATHVETDRLSPIVDWPSLSEETVAWAAASGLDLVAELGV